MNRETLEQFEVPTEVRAFAEKGVEQARKAFDGFVSAAHQAATSFEGRATAAQSGAKQVTQKAMTFAEQNISSSFDFLQKLVRAKDVNEVVKVHSDYVTGQIEALSNQAKDIGQAAARVAVDTAQPKDR